MVDTVAAGPEQSRVPRQARSHATRRALLVAAGERFAVQGYHATTLNDFLEAGVATKGALYFHFSSKQALAEALIAAMSTSWEQVPPAVRAAAADALEALVLLTDAVIVRLDDPIVRGAGRLLRDNVVPSPTLADMSDRWCREAEELLVEAQAAGLLRGEADPAWVARELVAGLAGRGTVFDSIGAGEPLWELMDDFWSGMLPLIATEEWWSRWAARPWTRRRRPRGVGPHDIEELEIHAVGELDGSGP